MQQRRSLLCALSLAALALSQSTALSINSVSPFSQSNLPNPPLFSLPSADNLFVSIALCSDPPSTGPPRFIVTNNAESSEVTLTQGFGHWNGRLNTGGTLRVENPGNSRFEIGISNNGPSHEILSALPFLGDTTSNQALLFSPPFSNVNATPQPPTYPNYILPPANPPLPSLPQGVQAPNFTLVLDSTSTSSLTTIPQTGCRLLAAPTPNMELALQPWLRDEDGWRIRFLAQGLTPATNYTAYIVQSGTKVSGPIYFATKSASFACPLVHSLPYCPSISYAVPLSAPPSPSPAHDATTLPSALVDPLLKYLTNFTVTLTTFPCGRKDEVYSPLKTCADCQRAYRKWLCTVSFPRCTERSPINDGSTQGGAQAPLAPAHTTVPAAHPPRNTHLPPFPSAYTALLPCLETCTAVDRACPSFLRFRCPSVRFNANESYGLGYIDGRNGKMGAGSVGAWMNRWGNVWCNGS